MEAIKLNVEARESGKGAAHLARRLGYVPGVLYGYGVKSATPLQVPVKEFERLIGAGGARHVVEMTLGGKKYQVMIKEIQRDTLRNQPIHVDFYGVSLKEKVHATVALVVHGAEAVAKAGGILEHQLHEVEVECLPTDLPDAIQINIASLGVGDHVSVADIQAPKGVKVLNDSDEVVLTIDHPKAEAEAEGTAAPAKGEPELVKSKKAEEE